MRRYSSSLLIALLTAALCLGGVAWLASSERAARERDLQSETQVVAQQFSTRLKNTLEKHVIALQQVANFIENDVDRVAEPEFHAFAAGTLREIPVCVRICRLDAALYIRDIFPHEPNRAFVGYDTRSNPDGYRTAVRAREAREPVFSPPIRLLDGTRGFFLAVPIFRAGRFAGEVSGTFRAADFIHNLRLPAVVARYDETILASGHPVVETSQEPGDSPADALTVSKGFSLAGEPWEVRVTPRDDVVDGRLRSGQIGFWAMGTLLALLAGCASGAAVHFARGMAQRVRRQEEALRQARQRLDGAQQQLIQAEKLSALGELVAGVAHELNNPLAAVMGYLQLLLARDLPADVNRRLETLFGEAERMARIVKNLLTFARKHPPEKRYLGLNGIIEKTLELKAYHFRVSQITVETGLDPNLPKTMVDFHQFQQVLINLFNNAEQAMAETGKGGRLQIVSRTSGGSLQVLITDNGPGIAPQVVPRIFEPFFTTKKEGKGTGLGLSMCYGIMQEHGGSIRVDSEPGRGATFVLEFPIARDQAVEARPPVPGPGVKRPLKILVVDDEQGVTDFLMDLLSSRGHQVSTALDVPEALLKIAREELDLIITDMNMPHGTGRDVYRAAVKARPHLARRVVFTSGSGTSSETVQFLLEIGSQIVPKPCSIGEIERAIDKAMAN